MIRTKTMTAMMKNGYLTLLGSCLLIACQQTELPQETPGYSDRAILFTSPYVATRSSNMRYGAFENNDKVGVLGYAPAGRAGADYSTSPWDTKKPFATPEVFYNEPLTYQGEGVWSYVWSTGTDPQGGLHPWYDDPDYTYAFFAYYPYVEVSGYANQGTLRNDDGESMGTIQLSGADETGDPTITYTLPHDGWSASSELDWEVVPDFMLAYKVDHREADGVVSLDFRHLLCAFEFEINNYNPQPVEITSLTFSVNNAYKSVTVTGQESGYSVGTDTYSGYFNIISTRGTHFTCPAAQTDAEGNVTAPTTVKLTTDLDAASADPIDLLFITDHDGKLTQNNGACTINIDTDLTNEQSMNINTEASFQAGVRSIFSINIVGNDFILQMRPTDNWEDGGDSDIVFE